MLIVKKQFESLTGGAIGTAAPGDVTSGQGMPTGNMILKNLSLGINYNLTIGTGTTPQTNGEILLAKSIYVNSDKHGTIVEGLDGMLLHRMLQHIWGERGQTTAYAAATGNYYTSWCIPMALPENVHAFRPLDSALDLLNTRIDTRIGFNTQSVALGTPGTASSIPTVNWSGELGYSPKEPPSAAQLLEGELPIWAPVFKQRLVPITATAAQLQIPLDNSGLIYLGLGIHQRNSSTAAEVTDIVVPSAKIRMEVNGVDRIQPTEARDLMSFATPSCEINAPTYAFTWLDFYSGSGMISDVPNTIGQSGQVNLFVDVVTSANRELRVGIWGLKPLNDAAKRASQLAIQ